MDIRRRRSSRVFAQSTRTCIRLRSPRSWRASGSGGSAGTAVPIRLWVRLPTTDVVAHGDAPSPRRVLPGRARPVLPAPGAIHTQRPAWQRRIATLEARAHETGRSRTRAFGYSPCTLCLRCAVEKRGTACRFSGPMRPSMEASGIDVFATIRAAGLACEIATDRDLPLAHYGLLPLE